MVLIKNWLAIFLAAVAIFSGTASAAPERVSDFALLDYSGNFHQLSRYLHKKALVVMSYDATCAGMETKVDQFVASELQWQNSNISFVFIDPLDLGRNKFNLANLTLPVLEDSGQLVSESLGVTRIGEVLVLSPLRSSVLYRGPVGENLGQVLEHVANDSIDTDTVNIDVIGCEIDYAVKREHQSQVPDYATKIAPIIIENCTECHRQDGVGPFALDSHIMLMGWSPMIREVLINKRMPPTQIDPYIGHSDSARYMSKSDMQALVHWIDAGAPRGESELDPLETLDFSNRKRWLLGEPDYIVKGPLNEIPPTGVLDYIYASINLPFEKDMWINAVQYLAGDESVLHHLMTYITAPGESFWGAEAEGSSITRRFVEGYAPGSIKAVEFQENTAVYIPYGHQLTMQFHYVTNGRATVDETLLALYLQDTAPEFERKTQAVSAKFEIPANDNNYALRAEHVFAYDATLVAVRAHMHFRGKNMKFKVLFPDGISKEILSVPAYNYGWQPNYSLTEPIYIPAGSKITVSGAFDNSESNPSNPDPTKPVSFGVESWEEMFTGYFTFFSNID